MEEVRTSELNASQVNRERSSPRSQSQAWRFVTSDGTALRVRDSGPPDAAVTYVLLHAWTLAKDSWSRVAARLAATPPAGHDSVRVITYDHRGHGESGRTRPAAATIDRIADDAAELIGDRVPQGPIVLGGHSLGGMALMALGERHPELLGRVGGVAFVNTSSGGLADLDLGLPRGVGTAGLRAERWVTRRIGAARRGVLSARTAWLRPGVRWLVFGDRPDRGDLADTASWIGDCQPAVLAGIRRDFDAHERRAGLRAYRGIPAAVLGGLGDRLCPPPHSEAIAEELPGAELRFHAGAAHMLPLERTGDVVDRLAGLGRIAADGAVRSA